MEKSKNKNFANTASRISAIASSVMDLHVRIALQEVDREKRRLISGGIFLAIGAILMLLTLLSFQIITVIWMQKTFNWNIENSLIILSLINITMAGISFRLGGHLTK